ncbi:MAG: hypothetical protein AAGM84_10645 [Pseudomonadota bacterium]
MFGGAVVGSGLANGARAIGGVTIFAGLLGLAMAAPVLAVAGWAMYLTHLGFAAIGLPFGWALGAGLAVLLGALPRFVHAKAADARAAHHQRHDRPLSVMEPGGVIAIQSQLFRDGGFGLTKTVPRLLLGGFDGVLLLPGGGAIEPDDRFELIRRTAPADDPQYAALRARLQEANTAAATDPEWVEGFSTSDAPMAAVNVAYLIEREVERPRIYGITHYFEIHTERVLKRTAHGWEEAGRETWVTYHRYTFVKPIPGQALIKGNSEGQSWGLRALFPTIWQGGVYRANGKPSPGTVPVTLRDLSAAAPRK